MNSTRTTLIPGSPHISPYLEDVLWIQLKGRNYSRQLTNSQRNQFQLGTCVSVNVSSLAQSKSLRESFNISSRTNSTLARSDAKKIRKQNNKKKKSIQYTNQ